MHKSDNFHNKTEHTAATTGGHSAIMHTISCYEVDSIIARSQAAPNKLLSHFT